MKEITLKIDDKLFKDLRIALRLRGMTGGLHGLLDSFVAGVIENIEEGESEWTPYRNEKT